MANIIEEIVINDVKDETVNEQTLILDNISKSSPDSCKISKRQARKIKKEYNMVLTHTPNLFKSKSYNGKGVHDFMGTSELSSEPETMYRNPGSLSRKQVSKLIISGKDNESTQPKIDKSFIPNEADSSEYGGFLTRTDGKIDAWTIMPKTSTEQETMTEKISYQSILDPKTTDLISPNKLANSLIVRKAFMEKNKKETSHKTTVLISPSFKKLVEATVLHKTVENKNGNIVQPKRSNTLLFESQRKEAVKTRNRSNARKLDTSKLDEELVFSNSSLVVNENSETTKALDYLKNHIMYEKNMLPTNFLAYQGTTHIKTSYVIFSKTNSKLPSPIRKSENCIVCYETIMVHGPEGSWPNEGASLVCDTGELKIGRLHCVHNEDHAPLVKKIWINTAEYRSNMSK